MSRHISLRHFQRCRNDGPTARDRRAFGRAEVRRWARLLIDQYGADAEELAEIGVIEMLALKNGPHLIAWSMIYAAILEIRAREAGRR